MQQPEGVADSAVERVVGVPQGLVQPAGDSRAEVRPEGRKRESYYRNTEVDMRVHGYGGDVSWEHTGWLLQTVRWPAKGQVQW